MSKSKKNITVLIALLILGVIIYWAIKYSNCGIDGDATQCNGDPMEVTKMRANGYYQKLNQYHHVCGSFPTTQQGLQALITPPTIPPLCHNYPEKPFISKEEPPMDGFGKPFTYISDGNNVKIISPVRQDYSRDKGWFEDGRADLSFSYEK